MSLKLKAIGFALLAAIAVSAVSVVSAPAEDETGGHFTSDTELTRITGADETDKPTHLTSAVFGTISCKIAEYHATTTTKTVESLTVTPTYEECEKDGISVHVDMTGCTYTFTVRKNAALHSTVHLVCPSDHGPTLTATGPFGHCTLEVTPTQTPTKGVTYANIAHPVKHAVTVNATAEGIHVVRTAGGFFQCGTSESTDANATLTGEVEVTGFEHKVNGAQVNITATGG